MRQHMFSDNWNFWTVKYLRQIRHNFSLLVCVGVLLLAQFLIFRGYIGDVPLPRRWPPWWLLALLIGCGIGTVFCVGNVFGGTGAVGRKWRQEERKHFTGLAPIHTDALFRGCLYSFLLTFGILYASCLFSWGATVLLFPGKTLNWLLWSLDAYLLSLILLLLLLIGLMDSVRPELFLLVGEFLFLPAYELHNYEFMLTLLLLCSAFYLALLTRESLLPAGAVREVAPRFSQLGFLGLAVLTPLPETAVVLAAGALASMGSAVDEIPHRQLKGLPGRFVRRLFAWLFYGSSAGGWLWSWAAAAAAWGVVFRVKDSFALFLVSWGLASAEAGFLLTSSMRRCSWRRMAAMGYPVSILAGWLAVGVAFAMIAVAFGIDGRVVFLVGAKWGWAAAAMLLLPNLPRMAEDYRKIVSGKTQ